ncbi:hypothetical protein NSZ01_36790 [Nocardioides szechwanensis]|nr:hypothetical protein NSZ01_36790 [Nocardioides szechwanensis]
MEEYDVSRHLGSLALAAALLLTTVGCSDDTPSDPEPSSSPSSDDSSGTPETSAPPTSDPPTPSVSAASGLRMTQGHLSVHAPEGWEKTPEPALGEFSEQADDPTLGSTLFIAELPDLAPGTEVDLRELARSAIRTTQYLRDPEIVEPVELDGVRWYHTSGRIDSVTYEDGFGTVAGGFFLRIGLRTGVRVVSPAEREELLASVLATVDLELA